MVECFSYYTWENFVFVRSPKLCNETNHKLFHHKDLHYCVGDPLKGEHREVNKVCSSEERCCYSAMLF